MKKNPKFHRTKRGRKENIRPPRYRILLVTEGSKTEPNYFKDLHSDLPEELISLFTIDIEGVGEGASALIKKAKDKIKNMQPIEFDEVWLVFDKDEIPASQFNTTIKNAQKENLKTAWSNEAFELWYLLHFIYFDTAISRDDYRKKIEDQLKKAGHKNFKYKKNAQGFYFLLKRFGNENKAIKFAKKLCNSYSGKNYANHNPCTTVFKLVENIRQKVKELKAELKN